MTTIWKEKAGSQSDRGYVTDDIGDRLATNSLKRILFHIGIFVNKSVAWSEKVNDNPGTIWTEKVNDNPNTVWTPKI